MNVRRTRWAAPMSRQPGVFTLVRATRRFHTRHLRVRPDTLTSRPCGGHSPNAIADGVGHEEASAISDRDADGATMRVVTVNEPGEHVDRSSARPTVGKWDEDYLVATHRLPIPRTMLANEHAVLKGSGQSRIRRPRQ